MGKRYYKIGEVAEIFGVAYDTVKKWCLRGDIDANNVGGIWFIPIEAVEHYERGLKPKRVVLLEKKIEALESQISDYKRQMRVVAGMLLQIEGENK